MRIDEDDLIDHKSVNVSLVLSVMTQHKYIDDNWNTYMYGYDFTEYSVWYSYALYMYISIHILSAKIKCKPQNWNTVLLTLVLLL